MANSEDATENNVPGEWSTDPSPTGVLPNLGDRARKFASTARRSVSRLGINARLLLVVVASILGAAVVLWIADKIVFYFLARTYVEQVANTLDLNEHLTNALVLLTFSAAFFFASFIWTFSKIRRFIGVMGLCALFVLHSLVLWYGTRSSYFDRSGQAIKCYVLTREGQVTYGERTGIDSATGRLCRPVTTEMLERLKQYEKGKRPREIVDANPTFFDPRTGEPIVWYALSNDKEIKLFDLMGFAPDSGEELLPITRDIVDGWKEFRLSHQIPKLIDPNNFMFFDPRNAEPRAWYWRAKSGEYEFYDNPGFQPQTGERLQIVTRDVVDAWKKQNGDREPQPVDPNKYSFFDPITGSARVWYWRAENGTYEFYDAPGFQPRTGDKLVIVTRDVIEDWKKANTPKAPENLPKADNVSLEFLAQRFIANHLRITEGSPSDVIDYIQRTYAADVDYYGARLTRQKVIEDQRKYMARWPQRSFRPLPGKTRTVCDGARSFCDFSTELNFRAYNPESLRMSAGVSTLEMRVLFSQGNPSIVSENGTVLSRESERAAPDQMPQLRSVAPQQNGIPPEQAQQIMRSIFGNVIRFGR